MMFKLSMTAAGVLSLISLSPEARAGGPGSVPMKDKVSGNVVTLAAVRAKKPAAHRPSGPGTLANKGRVVKDTCPGNDKACINDLIKNCDKAGGGLSTWEDGSVDCYVVGIHDQP